MKELQTEEFLPGLSLSKLGVMCGKGFVLAIRPAGNDFHRGVVGVAMLVHETDGTLDVTLDFGRANELVREAGWKMKWLPRYTWHQNGTMGYVDILKGRPGVHDLGLDFFTVTQ
jgi:hypothetical protein